MARLGLLAPRVPALTASLPQQTPVPAKTPGRRDKPLRWQTDAWRYYDDLGMIKFYANYRGNAFAKVRLLPAVIDPGGGPPIPADDPEAKIDKTLAQVAAEELASIQDPIEGQAGILRLAGLNEAVVGECRLLGRDDKGPVTEWTIHSSDELGRRPDGRWEMRSDPSQMMPDEVLPDGVFVTRLWRPHPRRRYLADCSMRGVLEDCNDLWILTQEIRATAQSRLAGSGLFAVKKGLDGRNRSHLDGDDDEPSQFVTDILEHVIAPIRDPGTAAAVAPLILELALGMGEKIGDVMQHITFSRDQDPVSAKERDEKRTAIAGGLDLPAEVILGMADLNHWGAWLVDDATWKSHLEPDVLVMCSQLTTRVLRPMIQARYIADGRPIPPDLDKLVVWYDAAAVVNHPNRGDDAQAAYDAIEISGDAYRGYKGFTEADAPDAAEVAARVERYRLMHARGALPGEIPSGDVVAPGENSGPIVKGPPDTGPPTSGKDGSQPAAPAAKATTAALTAAATGRPLADKLLSLDQQLRSRVEAAADTATRRALEKAGNKLATKAARQPALKAALAKVPRAQAAATLGRTVVASLDLTDDDLLDGCYDDLADQTDSWVDNTQRSALTVIVADLRRNGVQIATVASVVAALQAQGSSVTTVQILQGLAADASGSLSSALRDAANQVADDQAAGRANLLASMGARVRQLLYDPDPMKPPERGEFDGTVLVATGTIRGALNLYGGGKGDMPTTSLGVAYGARTGSVMTGGGYGITGWLWIHGAPIQPFEPHENLDGMVFENPDDPRLDAGDDGSWIDTQTGGYWPGDHDFCQCSIVPELQFLAASDQEAA